MAVQRDLDSQPREIEAMKAQELERLSQELQQIGQKYRQHIEKEVNQVATNACPEFEQDFRKLQARMIRRLDELLDTFSVRVMLIERATLSHPPQCYCAFNCYFSRGALLFGESVGRYFGGVLLRKSLPIFSSSLIETDS